MSDDDSIDIIDEEDSDFEINLTTISARKKDTYEARRRLEEMLDERRLRREMGDFDFC